MKNKRPESQNSSGGGTFKAILEKWQSHLRRKKYQSIERFKFPEDRDIEANIQSKYNYSGELLDIFVNNKANIVHKWHHYIPLYARYFSAFRNRKIRFLEIGVSEGGSLQMWRKYLGDDAIIFGVDINPACQKFDGLAGRVRIGSQDDANFLRSVVAEMGGIDVVLDDGSHRMEHIVTSLRTLFPLLNESGIYLIEDLHTAYWEKSGGGYKSKGNFFNVVRNVIDDMHHWYHQEAPTAALISNFCSGIHIHDSIVVLEKNSRHEPAHSEIS